MKDRKRLSVDENLAGDDANDGPSPKKKIKHEAPEEPELCLLADDEVIDFEGLRKQSRLVEDQCRRLRQTLEKERRDHRILEEKYRQLLRAVRLQQEAASAFRCIESLGTSSRPIDLEGTSFCHIQTLDVSFYTLQCNTSSNGLTIKNSKIILPQLQQRRPLLQSLHGILVTIFKKPLRAPKLQKSTYLKSGKSPPTNMILMLKKTMTMLKRKTRYTTIIQKLTIRRKMSLKKTLMSLWWKTMMKVLNRVDDQLIMTII
jgi:hypothetical protein